MNKAELEDKVNELELTLNSLELNAKTVKDDLKIVEDQLTDINKPKITKEFVQEMREAVEQAINQTGFDSVDSYDVDFEIGYNNTLTLSNIEFNGADDLHETVCDYIESLFSVVEE